MKVIKCKVIQEFICLSVEDTFNVGDVYEAYVDTDSYNVKLKSGSTMIVPKNEFEHYFVELK